MNLNDSTSHYSINLFFIKNILFNYFNKIFIKKILNAIKMNYEKYKRSLYLKQFLSAFTSLFIFNYIL